MLRIVFVLVIFGAFEYQLCCGDTIQTDDWRRQGFYRPRRNFPSQSQNTNSFQSSHSHNFQSQNAFSPKPDQSSLRTSYSQNFERQNPFGINYNQNSQTQSVFGITSQPQNSFGSGSQNLKTLESSRTNFVQSQTSFGTSYENSQNQHTLSFTKPSDFRSHIASVSNSQNSLKIGETQTAASQNYFGSRVSQNSFSSGFTRNQIGNNNGQNSFVSSFSQPQNTQKQNLFEKSYNHKTQNSYGNIGPNGPTQSSFGLQSQNTVPLQNASSSRFISNFGSNSAFAKNEYYKAPGYLPPTRYMGPEYLPPEKPSTSTFPPYVPPKTTTNTKPYITTTTKRPFYTTTTTRRPFYTTTKRPFYTTTTTRRPFYTTTTTTTRRPFFTTTTTKRPIFTTTTTKRPFFTTTTTKRPLFTTTTTIRPFYTTTTTKRPSSHVLPAMDTSPDVMKQPKGAVAPAMAMNVPPEPEDGGDDIIDDFPSTTTTRMTFRPGPAPAMAMLVPPEDNDPSTTTTTTPSTTTSTTTTTTTTTPSTTTSTTTTTTPPTTTSTTNTKRPFYRSHFLPAKAMQVPPEAEFNDKSPDVMKQPKGDVAPAMAMNVPPEPEDGGDDIIDDFPSTTTTRMTFRPGPAPAMAMLVPPEENDPSTTTTSTPSTITSTTPTATTTTPSTTVSMTSTTPSTTTSTTRTTTPPTTTSTTTTTPSTTTSTTATTPTTTSTTTPFTTTTTPSTTTSTTTTAPTTTITTTHSTTTINPVTTTSMTTPTTTTSTTTPSTTTSTTTPSTTTSITSTTTLLTTPSTTILTTTSSTTTPDPNRNLEDEFPTTSPKPETTTQTTSTTVTPTTKPYKAPEYLPPREGTFLLSHPPSPAIAMVVPPEPECDPLDPSTYPEIDYRSPAEGSNPCESAPTTTTTTIKPPFRGPLYLPPEPKTRVGRSSNNTLKLADLAGTPRPVWYAGIYRKTTNPYLPICGGSIIREDVVISAAHCFWADAVGKQPAELFAVATRKLYKPWKDPMDKRAQKSDVLDINIPPRFLGAKTSFQEDLAILKLATPFTYNQGVRPICVDFDDDFDRQQMKAGHLGTIAGWGYTDAAGTPTQRLLWLELPYVDIEKCIRDSEDSFLKYITCDKVCAGENDTGKALCRGDSGGGLAFWQGVPGHATPYLRGIASTAPSRNNAECNVFAYASFTHVRAHRTFLRDHVPDIENCRFWE